MALFPTREWIEALGNKLNQDDYYAKVARNWEGDMLFCIEAGDKLSEPVQFYLDLWHGKCRQARMVPAQEQPSAAFVLSGSFENYKRLLQGEIDPMQALLTRKLSVRGNMAILMRNVPTVLDFVRCAREITEGALELK